ncbi:MAG: VOC family protein [Pseudomonadota bacterium]
MARMTLITPFIYCNNLETQIAFFRDRLGFKVGFQSSDPGYAFLKRDNAAVRLLETDMDLSDESREQMVYIDVDDVDALWRELEPGLADLPKERVRAPFNQFYDQREFHVKDEGACLLLFGMDHPYDGVE